MKKSIILIAILVIAAAIMTSCAVKGYEYWQDEEGYEYLIVDGVQYSTRANSGWGPFGGSYYEIGHIVVNGEHDRDEHVCRYRNDPDHMMVMQKAKGNLTWETDFYRDDYDWPGFDIDSIDYIGISTGTTSGNDLYKGNYEYKNEDKEAIGELLGLFMTEKDVFAGFDEELYQLVFVNHELYLRGIDGLHSTIGMKDGKYWFTYRNSLDGEVFKDSWRGYEISEEVVRKITGDLFMG